MNNYKIKDYINKKWNDIAQDTPTMKAYNLGLAVGLLETYKSFATQFGEDDANKSYDVLLNGNEDFNVMFRTMVGLYNKETNFKVDSIIEKMENYKRPEKSMTDEDRDLIEEFIEFLYKKI